MPTNCVTLLRVSTERRITAEDRAGRVKAQANGMMNIREVRKRDSRVVPFDLDKISDAIHRAQLSVGAADAGYARELAEVVGHFLATEISGAREDGIPHIEEIQDVVEKVLMSRPDCGEIAKSYILYRRKREVLRQTLEVRQEKLPPEKGTPGEFPAVEKTDAGVSSWKKALITAALIREADLDPSLAEEIAASVEAKVLRTGILLISTSLIRELVDNELFERGYDAKLKKQAPLSLPKYDIERMVHGEATGNSPGLRSTPREIEQDIARRMLLQYSLEEVLSPEVARAHRNGRFYVHDLGNPLRCYRLLAGHEDALSLQEPGIGELVSREVQVSNVPLTPSAVDSLSLSSPGQPGAVPELVIEVDTAQDGCGEFFDSLLERVRRGGEAPHLLIRISPLSTREIEELATRLVLLAGAGIEFDLVPLSCSRLQHSAREPVLVAGKTTINLPRAAYRSARGGGASIETELDEIVALAVKGLRERTRLLGRVFSGEESPFAALCGIAGIGAGGRLLEDGATGIIGLVGLNECVRYLCGAQLQDSSSAGDKALEIIGGLQERLEVEENRLGLSLVLEESRNQGQIRRLQAMDGRLYPENLRGLEEAGAFYSSGLRSGDPDPLRAMELLAPYLTTVVPRAGVVGSGLSPASISHEQYCGLIAGALEIFSSQAAAVIKEE